MKLERLAKLGATTAVLGTIGCSDPVPPPAQASVFFTLRAPTGTTDCASTGYTANLGGPPASSRGDPGPRVVDGQDDARVGCRVSGSGTFSVSGTVERGATSFIVMNATVPAGGQGTATIAVAGPGTAGKQLTSGVSQPCTIFVNREPFQIAEGNTWAEFDCPFMSNPNTPGATCGSRGEFVFENCEQ